MTRLVMTGDSKALSTRALVVGLFVRLALLFLAAILILRVALPYLIDAHSDLALALAFVLAIASLAALIWFIFDLLRTVRRALRRGQG